MEALHEKVLARHKLKIISIDSICSGCSRQGLVNKEAVEHGVADDCRCLLQAEM